MSGVPVKDTKVPNKTANTQGAPPDKGSIPAKVGPQDSTSTLAGAKKPKKTAASVMYPGLPLKE